MGRRDPTGRELSSVLFVILVFFVVAFWRSRLRRARHRIVGRRTVVDSGRSWAVVSDSPDSEGWKYDAE
jgi:hypothetical protein